MYQVGFATVKPLENPVVEMYGDKPMAFRLPSDDASSLDRLSPKQRECLELVLQHQTSKQIAQKLRISRHTVDQRLDSARRILDAQTRVDAAVAYDRMRRIHQSSIHESTYSKLTNENHVVFHEIETERFAHEPFAVGTPAEFGHASDQPNVSGLLTLEDAAQSALLPPWEKDAVIWPFAGSLAGANETVRRLTLIAGISLLMMAVAIVALALAESLTRLMSG